MLKTNTGCRTAWTGSGKGKGKVHPRTDHEGPEREGGWSTPRPGRFYPREGPGTNCIGGWVGIRAGLDRCGKSRPHRDSIPGPSSP